MDRVGWQLAMVAWAFLALTPGARTQALQSFPNARLQAHPNNDGDSFLVSAGKQEIAVRLYFVDCPETKGDFDSTLRRLREQTRYFGLSNTVVAARFGAEAKKLTDKLLARPFTVHTSFAQAPGARVYAFVTTAEGKDLGTALLEAGLARVHGLSRETPDGVSTIEATERLHDLQAAAMLRRRGVWAQSNPDQIPSLRREQRREDAELGKLRREMNPKPGPAGRVDLNTATKEQLMTLRGIGPVLAERIIAARPFQSVDDLARVKGIGKKELQALSGQVEVRR